MTAHQHGDCFAEVLGILFLVDESHERHRAGAQHSAGFLLR
jgi:hypothetical protein